MSTGFTSPVDFRLSLDPPENLEPEVKAAFLEVYQSMQQVFRTFNDYCGIGPQPNGLWAQLAGDPTTVLASNLNRLYVELTESVVYGAMVNLHDSGGLKARNANATNNTKPAHGFCNSAAGDAGDVIEVIVHTGTVTINGLTPGDSYFLSTTDGVIANGPAIGAGNIEQLIGIALSTDVLLFNQHYWIQH